jgi:penicillin-binding protein 1A
VQAASRAYFDKDVAELTLPEAAYLAVLHEAPS